jgi:hypothetical protein
LYSSSPPAWTDALAPVLLAARADRIAEVGEDLLGADADPLWMELETEW